MAFVKPVAFLVIGLLAGVLLAVDSLQAGAPTGWIGAVALVAWAFVARQRWRRIETTSGLEPGAPERILWLRSAGNSLILGHVVASIMLAGDELRLGNDNSLAIDSWTMVLAQFIAALAFRGDGRERDERHNEIRAHGVRAGYATLVASIVALLAWLAFTPPEMRSALSQFVLANTLVVLLLVSYGAMLLVQLIDYARDMRHAMTSEQPAPPGKQPT